MRIEIAVAAARLRRWHLRLAAKLESVTPGARVRFRLGAGSGPPSSVELLLALERVIHRLPGPRPFDRLSPGDVASATGAEPPDLLIVLDEAAHAPTGRRLSVRYDGGGDDAAVFAALIGGNTPLIEVVDERGETVAQGRASTENAHGVAEGYEHVVLRTITLVAMALRRPQRSAGPSSHPGRAASGAVLRYGASTLARMAARRLYKLCCHAPHWRVGWRFVTEGDVWDRQDLGGTPWSVLPDPGLRFYADPFPITWQGETWLFVEDLDHRHGKGVISAIPFGEAGPSGPMRPVLEEPWHLSYPLLLEHAGALWMLPESSTDRSLRIYRCERFPDRWVEAGCLMRDIEVSDATPVRHAGRWWLFASTRDDEASYSDTLSLFTADDLLGPWSPHPANPLLVDAASARPAGHVVQRDGRLWRPVQDCRRGYGTGLGLAEITRLDDEGFAQEVRTLLRPGAAWPGRRLHTLNRAGRLECIDGSGHSPKLTARAGR